MNPEIIGMIAGTLTTIAYFPQMVKVLRHKDTKSLSLGMYILVSCGLGFWTVYGIMLGSPSLILANGITTLMALVILTMKIRHG